MPHHCQLGSALDSVDGVKAMFLTPTFRLSQSQVGRGHKIESNQLQRQEATLLKVLHSCLSLGTDGREGRCLRLIRTSTFKPCHIICQLGSGPNNVNGVKAVF